MPTTGLWKGGVGTLYKDVSGTFTKLGCLTSVEESFEAAEIDVSCHETTGAWGAFIAGRKTATIEAEGFYSQDTANVSFEDLYADWENNTTIGVRWKSSVSGDIYIDYDAVITNLTRSTPNTDDVITFSVSLRVTGQPTTGTNA
jgi:predicted secreted protein